jgi:hypothetical protein
VSGARVAPDPGTDTLSNLETVEKAMAAPQSTTPSPYGSLYPSAYPSP